MKLMIDSGAFSAWSRGKEINIEEYAKYCHSIMPHLSYIVNLDVIPGKGMGDKAISASDLEASATQGYKNYEKLLSLGLPKEKILHVFHMGEDFKWLRRMVKEIPYIGISPANDRSTEEKQIWLDECMQFACDDEGTPLVKFHGFGVTALPLIFRYPWFSVDSTRWGQEAAYGHILVPMWEGGKWVYHKNAHRVTVSSRKSASIEDGKHFDVLPPTIKAKVAEYIALKGYTMGTSKYKWVGADYKLDKTKESWTKEEKDGKKEVQIVIEEGLSNSTYKRSEINVLFFMDLERQLPKWPWKFKYKKQRGFFK